MGEMIKTSSKVCRSCVYGCRTANIYTCDYLLMTNKRRGCKYGECDKYERRTKKRNNAIHLK